MPIQLLPPTQFRFIDPEDVEAYGDGWHIWDEQALLRLRGREQIALEDAVDIPLRVLIEMLRTESTLAYMAAMWIVLHREGHKVKWADFNPAVHLAEWEAVPKPDPLGEESGEDPAPDSASSTEPDPESATS